ncbi:MAG: hypothetical protein J0I41_00845 [Filimonas sp.]|nr:hypothetical protein [Filimonas sp.]
MEQLIEKLFTRWELAFDEIPRLAQQQEQAKTIVYAKGSRFDIDKFDFTHFPSSGPLLTNTGDHLSEDLYEYGLNDADQPCYVKFQHTHNNVHWAGYYSYSPNLVEFVEYCLETGVPSIIHCIEFDNGHKISSQRLAINGRAGNSSFIQQAKSEIIQSIKDDENAFFLTVTVFEYDKTDRLNTSSSIHITPGAGKYMSYDSYTYDEIGQLATIRKHFENGESRIAYSKATKDMTQEDVIEHIATAIARAGIEALQKQNIDEPIALLELSYHYADSYLPILTYQSGTTIETKLQAKEYIFISDYNNFIHIEHTSFEDVFSQLEQLMNDNDDPDLGRIMLLKAASLLNQTKLEGKIKVTDDFAAYAIDWSIEGHSDKDFEEILLQCGVHTDTLHNWKQKGILPTCD